ncbi:MAG: hypothetical protein ACR2GY_09485 [Phycisphaerales bacterium]
MKQPARPGSISLCIAAILALSSGCGGGKDGSSPHALDGSTSRVDAGLDNYINDGSSSIVDQTRQPAASPGAGVVPDTGAAALAAQFERDMADFEALQNRSRVRLPQDSTPTQQPLATPERDFPGVRPANAGPPRDDIRFTQPSAGAASPLAPGQPAISLSNNTNSAAAINAEWDPTDPFGRRTSQRLDAGTSGNRDGDMTDSRTTVSPEMRLGEAMVALRRELFQNAAYADSPLREYLVMAALAMVDPDRALNPDALNDLDDREREILRAYQQFFIEIGAELATTGDEAVLIEKIEELRQAVTNTGPLTVARAAFCTSVEGFGRYTPFEKSAFLAGAQQDVIVYMEVEDFTSTENENGQWVTDLWVELILYDRDHVPVWRRDWSAAPDVAERKRTDFYINYIVTLPERLTLGKYTMKVRVRDDATGSVAEAGIDFQIVADASVIE